MHGQNLMLQTAFMQKSLQTQKSKKKTTTLSDEDDDDDDAFNAFLCLLRHDYQKDMSLSLKNGNFFLCMSARSFVNSFKNIFVVTTSVGGNKPRYAI